MVSRVDALPVACPGLYLLGLGPRHHGRLSLCHHLVPGHERSLGNNGKRRYRLVRRHRSEHLHDRLGSWAGWFLGTSQIATAGSRPWRLRFSFTHRLPVSPPSPATWQELAFYRFLTGLGIGGEWAAGAALIAESFPEKSRAKAAGIMQASGGIGFFLATGLYLFIGPYGWRWVFALGVLPALVAFYIRQSLEEPDRWIKARQKGKPFAALFAPAVRRDVFVGTGLAVVATFGYQGAIQWVPSWIAAMLHAQGTRTVIPQVSLITTTLTTGGIIGCLCLPFIADRWGRKGALFVYFLGALLSVPTTFMLATKFSHAVLAVADHGILCLRGHRRLCHLFSRIVSHRYPRHGARLLF